MKFSIPLEPTMIIGSHHVVETNSSPLVMGSRVVAIDGSKWGVQLIFLILNSIYYILVVIYLIIAHLERCHN